MNQTPSAAVLILSCVCVCSLRAGQDSLAMDNGRIRVLLVRDEGAYRETWFAGHPGDWHELAAGREGLLIGLPEGEAEVPLTEASRVGEGNSSLMELRGAARGVECTETIALEPGSAFASVRVAMHNGEPLDVSALLSTYAFAPGGLPAHPDFVFAPQLCPAPGEVIADHVFRAPAFIMQRGTVALAIVPALETIDGRYRPLSAGGEVHASGERGPFIAFGLMNWKRTREHVYYMHADSMVSHLPPGEVSYGFFLYANSSAPPREAYREIVRFQWDRYGRAWLLSGPSPQSAPFASYVYEAWHEFVPAVALDTVYRGVPVTLLRQARLAWSNHLPPAADNDCWFNVWFNALRTAYGMYIGGSEAHDTALCRRAERVLNLALLAPRAGGLAPTIFYMDSAGGHWVADQAWGGIDSGRYLPMFHNAWTAAWMLSWAGLIPARRAEITDYARGIASFLVAHQERSGVIPSWYDPATGEPSPVMRDENAETAGGALFLARYAASTGDAAARGAAERAMDYVFREIVPRQKWFDFETFFSCSRKPVGFFDTVTGQYAQNTLSMDMAAEACASLYALTGSSLYRERGSAILDELSLFQQVWSPRWLSRELFGGFGVQNSDAEWSDARQGYFAVTYMNYFDITGRREYFERGVAALRAMFSLFESPVSPRTAENYGHSGGDDPAGVTGLHWGTGSSVVSVHLITQKYGDAFVDIPGAWGAGIDGCTVPFVSVTRDTVRMSLIDDVGAGRRLRVKFAGTGGRHWSLIVNGLALGRYGGDELERGIPVASAGRTARERLFAAVLLVRGNVAGGSAPGYGVFVKGTEDTAWHSRPVCRTMAFGLGLFEHGGTRRYYVAGGNGLHCSTDGGKTWKILTSWRTEEILSVVPDPVDSLLLYVATPEGAFRSTDGGTDWGEIMSGIPTRFVQRLAMDLRERGTLYAATETDMFKTTDGGEHWQAMGSGLADVLAFLQLSVYPRVMIAAGESSGLRRTVDGGAHWRPVRGLEGATIYALQESPTGELYAAGWKTGLWRSDDRGESWHQVYGAPNVEAVYAICVAPGSGDHILLGTVGGGIMESFDRGATWRSGGLDGAQVKQIEYYP